MDDIKYFLIELISSNEAQIIFRILLATCFGALIGLEREHAHRPAGLRTHILVCVGACLVMLTSEFTYNYYHQFSPNMDIARLGAQVISGIGFLGAGTIIRNGSSVKGLTTAASIWAVACIGLATGIGFYFGATIATIVIFICLGYIKKSAVSTNQKKITLTITSESKFVNSVISNIETKFSENSININKISIKTLESANSEILFQLITSDTSNPSVILGNLNSLPGIISVNLNSEKIKDEE